MKRILAGAVLCAVILTSSAAAWDAAGSVFGNLSTATAIGQGRGEFMAGVGVADATSFFGTYTHGLSKYMNGRLKLGLADPGEGADTKVVFGADLLWQIWDFVPAGPDQKGGRYPFDMAVGGLFEYADYGEVSVLELGGFALGSYPFRMQNGSTLSPYGRLNIRLESISVDTPVGDADDSNLEFGLNGGLKWQVTRATSLFGEFQFDGNDGVFFGVNFGVM